MKTTSSYRLLISIGFIAGLVNTHTFAASPEPTFTWPHGAKAAVNLSYDDALNSQLDIAIPALDKYQLKGTFYVTIAGSTLSARLEDWRTAATTGHELANHSIFHQCSRTGPGRDWVAIDKDLDRLSAEHMQEQVRVASAYLHAVDGKTERTYTPPCIDLKAGGTNYVDGLRTDFVAIRAQGGGVTNNMWQLDPYAVGVDFPSDVSGEQLIARVKEAAHKGTMVNFTFHGVGGDHMSVSKEAHDQLLAYLAANRAIYWTDTFINIMKHVKQEQAKATSTQ